VDGSRAPAYRSLVAEWLTIEVLDADVPATQWRRGHGDALLEAAVTHGAITWEWHDTRWGLVLELLFTADEDVDRYRDLPGVQAALDAVPDRARGLLVYRGRGGGAGAAVPRRPRPVPLAAAAALPDPEPDEHVRLAGPGDPRADPFAPGRQHEAPRPVGV
jgi:hypothetical protein